MRARLVPSILALTLAGLTVFISAPAPASSGYEMFGGGTLTAGDAVGMPACTRFTEYGNQGDADQSMNCNSTKSTSWTFGTLPIFSDGVLFDRPQAATYGCGNSTVTTIGSSDNFKVNFSFNCDLTAGTGWPKITGFFSSSPAGGCTGPCGAGQPYWEGQFNASDGATTAGPVHMMCGGMFEPTAFGTNSQGPTITAVLFEGECTAAG